MSAQNTFRQVMAKYGLSAGAAAFAAYKSWCDMNPSSRICGQRKSIEQFAHMTTAMTGKSMTRVPQAAAASAAAPVAIGAPKLRIAHKFRCEGEKLIVTATDFVSQIASPSSMVSGTSLGHYTFSPLGPMFDGSRLKVYATIFEKYRLRRLKFHFTPAIATSNNGQFVMAWDNDPADGPVSADMNGIRQLFSYRSNVTTSIWEPVTLNCVLDPTTNNLFTNVGEDIRLYAAGSLQIAAIANIPVSLSLGSLWVEYEVELSSPSELAAGPTDSYVAATSATNRVYSTTTSILGTFVSGGENITTVGSGISVGIGPAAQYGLKLTTGTYIIEYILTNQTTAVACGLVHVTDPVEPGSTGSAYTSSVNQPAVAAAGSAITHRDIFVVSGTVVRYTTVSAGSQWPKVFIRAAPYTGTVSAAGIDNYGF